MFTSCLLKWVKWTWSEHIGETQMGVCTVILYTSQISWSHVRLPPCHLSFIFGFLFFFYLDKSIAGRQKGVCTIFFLWVYNLLLSSYSNIKNMRGLYFSSPQTIFKIYRNVRSLEFKKKPNTGFFIIPYYYYYYWLIQIMTWETKNEKQTNIHIYRITLWFVSNKVIILLCKSQ